MDARMRVADIKKLAAARRSAFNARSPMTTPTKPKRKPDSALDAAATTTTTTTTTTHSAFHPKRPRTVKDLPHARASPGAAEEIRVERQTTDDQTLGGFDPDRGPRTPASGPVASGEKIAASNATAPGERGARKPRAKPTPATPDAGEETRAYVGEETRAHVGEETQEISVGETRREASGDPQTRVVDPRGVDRLRAKDPVVWAVRTRRRAPVRVQAVQLLPARKVEVQLRPVSRGGVLRARHPDHQVRFVQRRASRASTDG